MLHKPRTSPWTTTGVVLCITVLVCVAITPTVIVTLVVARLGWNLEQKASPFVEQVVPVLQDARDIARTASISTRIFHQLLNQSMVHTQRIPHAMDLTIGAINDTRTLVKHLSHIAERPAMTVSIG